MPSTWEAAYTPLLALQDPDHPAQRGGLLVAGLGKGTYVYTGLAFFRQLPAGVPGAYRLFANLLALGRSGAERQAHFASRGQERAGEHRCTAYRNDRLHALVEEDRRQRDTCHSLEGHDYRRA